MGMLVPLLISTSIVLFITKVRVNLTWFRCGNLDEISIILVVVMSLASVFMLIAWGYWSNSLGIGVMSIKSLTVYPRLITLGILIPAFALVNSFVEEAIYRGVMQQALINVFNAKVFIIFLQASAFASAHVVYGFPNGKIGYLMVLVYGALLGYLRYRTKGILAPYVTHVTSDLVIGYFLYFIAV